jgi:hypothetical protein
VGKAVTVENAPVTTGGTVSLRVEHASAKLWRVIVDPHGKARDLVLHLPVDDVSTVSAVRVNGLQAAVAAELQVSTASSGSVVEVEVR